MKLKFWLFPLLVFVLSACQPNITQYKAVIEDAVRFQLSVCNSVAEFDDFYDLMEWFSDVTEMAEQFNSDGKTYREMLVELSSEDDFYQSILELYDATNVILSEPIEEVEGRVWTFYEINTEINFTFTLIPAQNGDVYYKCEADEDQLAELMQSYFIERVLNLIK